MKTTRTLFLAAASLVFSLAAHAIQVVPFGGNQSAAIGTFFHDPVGVRVLDDLGNPQVNVPVTFTAAQGVLYFYEGGQRGDSMTVFTDADGVADTDPGLFAWMVGTTSDVSVTVDHPDGHFPATIAGFTVLPGGPVRVDVVSGSHQLAVAGKPFCHVLEAVALDAGGAPVPDALVLFLGDGTVGFGAASYVVARADANGRATAPVPTAGTARGTTDLMAIAYNVGAVRYGLFRFIVLPPQAGYRCR